MGNKGKAKAERLKAKKWVAYRRAVEKDDHLTVFMPDKRLAVGMFITPSRHGYYLPESDRPHLQLNPEEVFSPPSESAIQMGDNQAWTWTKRMSANTELPIILSGSLNLSGVRGGRGAAFLRVPKTKRIESRNKYDILLKAQKQLADSKMSVNDCVITSVLEATARGLAGVVISRNITVDLAFDLATEDALKVAAMAAQLPPVPEIGAGVAASSSGDFYELVPVQEGCTPYVSEAWKIKESLARRILNPEDKYIFNHINDHQRRPRRLDRDDMERLKKSTDENLSKRDQDNITRAVLTMDEATLKEKIDSRLMYRPEASEVTPEDLLQMDPRDVFDKVDSANPPRFIIPLDVVPTGPPLRRILVGTAIAVAAARATGKGRGDSRAEG